MSDSPASPDPSASPVSSVSPESVPAAPPLLFVCSYPGADGPPNAGPGNHAALFPAGMLSAWDGDERVAVLELAPAPSYGAFADDGRLLYLVREGVPGVVTTVDVAAFLDGRGEAAVLDSRSSGGAEPCYLRLSPSGRRLAVGNYCSESTPTDGGVLTIFTLGADGIPDGPGHRLALTGSGPDPVRQPGAHAHQAVWLDEDRLLLVDLGSDAVISVAVAADGTPAETGRVTAVAGSGPRHLALLPGGGFVLAEELSGTVSLWTPDDSGALVQRARVGVLEATVDLGAVPDDAEPDQDGPVNPSAIVLSADGATAHVAVRGPDVVSTVAIAPGTGEPLRLLGTAPTVGNWPRDLLLDGDRLWIANQGSSSVVALAVHPATHRPGHPVQEFEVAYPNWLGHRPV